MVGLRPAVMVLAATLCAQPIGAQSVATVTGVVLDDRDAPVPGVFVFVGQGPSFVTTDGAGAFRLQAEPGEHVLSFRRDGFDPRSFALSLGAGTTERNLGEIELRRGDAPVASLVGQVTQQIDGQPLADATIEVNGVVIARTDAIGAFMVRDAAVRWGPNEVTIRHEGLTGSTLVDEFWIANPNEIVELQVSLEVAPIPLPGVAVAAAARSPRLEARGFYERRTAASTAVFYTADEILDRAIKDWEDLLRGIRFTRTRAATSFGNSGDPTPTAPIGIPYAQQVERQGQCGADALPLAFLDGSPVGTLPTLVESVRVEMIEGLEIYRGVANLPMEFNLLGAECGVVVVWTQGSF